MYENILNNTRKKRLVCLGFVTLCLVGCGSASHGDLQDFVDSVYQDEKPEIEPLPPIEPYDEFLYSAAKMNDPFDSKNVLGRNSSQGDDANARNANRRKEPLEDYSIKELSLSGVLKFRGGVSALFKSPDNETIAASVGNYIGRKNGRIKSIDSESQIVHVEEVVKGSAGNFDKRTILITGNSKEDTK